MVKEIKVVIRRLWREDYNTEDINLEKYTRVFLEKVNIFSKRFGVQGVVLAKDLQERYGEERVI